MIYLTRGDIFTEVQSTKVNMLPRSDIEGMDQLYILYMTYRMVSETNLFA